MEPPTRREIKKTAQEKKYGGNRIGTGAGTRAKINAVKSSVKK
jgi:hypothetical protein